MGSVEKLVEERESACVLFDNAEEAWFWYCKYEEKSGYKRNNSNSEIARPCMLSDIYLSVAKLYFAKKIKERHVRTLVKYGRRLCPPDARLVGEQDEAIWWDDAMDKLETVLAKKGIVRRD